MLENLYSELQFNRKHLINHLVRSSIMQHGRMFCCDLVKQPIQNLDLPEALKHLHEKNTRFSKQVDKPTEENSLQEKISYSCMAASYQEMCWTKHTLC